MAKKYELTKNTKKLYDRTLYQIKALRSFSNVLKGDLGGWIEKEANLSQDGDAWVYGDAQVYGNADIFGNARVFGNAWVYGDAWVSGDAWVYGKIKISAGNFFGMRYNKEEIKFKENEGQEIIYKGEAIFGDNNDDDVEIIVEGNKKVISRKSAKALNLIN